MNFDQSLLFCYLEEDNIQRAYFRVRPLLSAQGDVREQATQLWPSEGALRIVPDRAEQHTFKVRMRTLGPYCVVDLRGQPVEAGKIRTNKNFRPDRGEVNQYILYSDTVHELPENSFYQIIAGKPDAFADAAKDAITPLFYLQDGDTLYGPVRRSAPAAPDTAKEAAGVLFALPCPDGTTRMMLCMDDAADATPEAVEMATVEPAEPAQEQDVPVTAEPCPTEPAAPAEKADACPLSGNPPTQGDSLPIAEKLTILDQTQTHDATLRQLDQPVSSGANLLRRKSEPVAAPPKSVKPADLSGTPLVPTPLRVATPQPKNHTQEVVRAQWSVGKYEPPTENLPRDARLRDVNNPVESACTHLRSAWHAAGTHEQLADFILSLQGMRSLLERKLCAGEHVTILQRVLRDRLQDLEAERLTALCELDRAHRDVDSYKQELIAALSSRIARETEQLTAVRDEAKAQADALKQELTALTHQRDAMQDRIAELQAAELPEAAARLMTDMQMALPIGGIPLRMSPVPGEQTGLEELIGRVTTAVQASGIEITRNEVIVLLLLLATSDRIGISCATPAPLVTLTQNVMSALGWQSGYAHQYAAEQRPVCGVRPVDATPALLATALPNYAPIPGVTKLFMNRTSSALTRNAAYDAHAWPIMTLPALPFVAEAPAADVLPVSFASVQALAEQTTVSDEELDKVLLPILKAAMPLSGAARKALYRFASVCAGLLEGGLPVAVDWAVSLWIIPALEKGGKFHAAVKPLLDEYPMSLAKM